MRLAASTEAPVSGLGGRLPADGHQGRPVEQVERLSSPATDVPAATMLAGVAVEGSDADQGAALRRPSSGMSAQRQAALTGPKPGIDWVMASRRESSASTAMHARMRRSQSAMSVVRASSVALAQAAVAGPTSTQSLRRAPSKSLSCWRLPGWGGVGLAVVEETEAGEHGRIDAVDLGELAEGLGEAPGAQGVD